MLPEPEPPPSASPEADALVPAPGALPPPVPLAPVELGAFPPPSPLVPIELGAFPPPMLPAIELAPLAGQSATATLASAPEPRVLPPEHSLVTPYPRRPAASLWFLWSVTVISLVADLASKWWAKSRLSGFDVKAHGPHRIEIWKGHLDFIFAQNPGGAWSFLRGLPDTLRRPFFLVVSAAAIVFIVSIYRRIHTDQRAMKWGLPLALGGAMGNLVDRIRYGWVVDFVDVYISRGGREHHWPTFNVADIAIVAGVGLMAVDMLWHRGGRHHPTPVGVGASS